MQMQGQQLCDRNWVLAQCIDSIRRPLRIQQGKQGPRQFAQACDEGLPDLDSGASAHGRDPGSLVAREIITGWWVLAAEADHVAPLQQWLVECLPSPRTLLIRRIV
jgi:hypothetical protein